LQQKKEECLLIRSPTETTKEEQLPLIPAHANILQSPVDHLRLAYIESAKTKKIAS
jgi:hypothetical protein